MGPGIAGHKRSLSHAGGQVGPGIAVAGGLISMLAVFFAIVGVQLLGGILGNHCFRSAGPGPEKGGP